MKIWNLLDSNVFDMDVLVFAVFLFGGFLISCALTPFVISLALKVNVVATTDRRRRHEKDTPLLGGISIFVAAICAGLFALSSRGRSIASDSGFFTPAWITLISILSIFSLGVVDDWKRLTARPKLLVQIFASLLFLLGNHSRVDDLNLPWAVVPSIYLGLTVFMVGIMNAVNMVDGMDGLCAGSSAISAFFFMILAYKFNLSTYLIHSLGPAIIGACGGFLIFNRRPAKIFLGDSGSLTLGFFLGASCVELMLRSGGTFTGVVAPLLVLGYPMLDAMSVIYLRLRAKRPIMSGDRNHFHHRLCRLGVSPKRTVQLLWFISFYFGLQTLFIPGAPSVRLFVVIFSLSLLVYVSILSLSFLERSLALQLSKFGQANLGPLLPARMEPHHFFKEIEKRLETHRAKGSTFCILVIDYMKIMPQMLHQSPETIDRFFRESHEIISHDIRENALTARLSDSLTAVLLTNSEADLEANETVLNRVTTRIRNLQFEYHIMSTDSSSIEGVSLISYPKEFFQFCQRLNMNMDHFQHLFPSASVDVKVLVR